MRRTLQYRDDAGELLVLAPSRAGVTIVTTGAFRFPRAGWLRFIAEAAARDFFAPSARDLVEQLRLEDPGWPEVST